MGGENTAAHAPSLWDEGGSLERLREAFGEVEIGAQSFRGQTTLVVPVEALLDVLAFLRDDPECGYDFLTDVTAVHWPADAQPFEIVYHLYSFGRHTRLRVKTRLGPEATLPSVVELWPGANWLERECYDMFGVTFEGHPDLRRILMPDDFEGWPLRKEFPLKC
ncbi:MAG: NADH-quinone oxidoreductase subunit C [Acidobacteriota bacterium]|nr:NADH-quinone oxidoreductase subunit C [Acidobacteriota bacterium]MDQ7087635.1 NADH-quinone oxidoreductase subunit C [Acidobacteriota bacterium]